MFSYDRAGLLRQQSDARACLVARNRRQASALLAMSTPMTSSTDFGIDSDVDSDDQSSPVEDLMIGMSQPSSALPQFSSKALDPENNRNWAESLQWIAAHIELAAGYFERRARRLDDDRSRVAMMHDDEPEEPEAEREMARRLRVSIHVVGKAATFFERRTRRPDDDRSRDSMMHDDEPEEPEAELTADDGDDVVAPANDLLRLLSGNKRESKRKSADARLLTWHIGQKRPARGVAKDGKESEWVLVGKYATKEEARAAARCRPNGVKFRKSNNGATHWYYVCATHEDKGCPCVMKVSRPMHRGAAGDWIVERRDGETCDAHAEIRSEEVIARETHDLVDADGAPAIGVAPMKHCRAGRQRGVHPNLISLITRLRKEGMAPAAVLTELHKLWNNGGLEGSITMKGDLPSAKQLKVRMIPTSFLCSQCT
jgi:hypothetical protein